ncbi:MAG TPA: hypothetical protein VLV84_01390 [Candidatus Acidoferrales bacterium]|nr:hypothetical protein [Candidatus Acidoferrales bacterium]
MLSEHESDLLERLNTNIQTLNEILNKLIFLRSRSLAPNVTFKGFDTDVLLSLPDHLRKTMIVVLQKGRVTAQDVADSTKRARALESAYLNQMLNRGYLKLERKGRKAFFFLEFEPCETPSPL